MAAVVWQAGAHADGSHSTLLFNDHRVTADPALAHRRSEARITVLGPDGQPVPDTEVEVAQLRHRFGFGCIGFDFVDHANGDGADRAALEQLAELWFELFNVATLPFYWGGFEPEPGMPKTERLRAAARWFVDRGVSVKGHPLTWHTIAPPWLLDLSSDQVLAAQRARIQREVGDFAGLIEVWDAINEAVIMPVFDKEDNGITRACRRIGRIEMVRLSFEEARAANPNTTLLLNDFDMSTAFECLIEGVLEAGIDVDVIGLQSHMHQGYWGEEKTLGIIDRFARYGLPIHFTESTILSGHLMPAEIVDLNDYQVDDWPSTPEDEERQAEEIVRHYRTLLSHPSVQAATYWGLTDAGAWLGAPVGLVRPDGTTKPAYHALRDLIKGEWWLAPTTMRSDAAGAIQLEGFLGDYLVSALGRTARVGLDAPGTVAVEAQLNDAT